jgi:hypothetical protein
MEILDKGGAIALVYAAVDEVNKQLPRSNRLEKAAATLLYGPGGHLDSLGLVNLLVNTEEKIAATCGVEVSLVEEVGSDVHNYVGTIESFSEFVRTVIEKKCNG